ncbi:MAG TPA: hypothetical protein DCM08_00530 [Microscillaceae bacterium]|jgi:hypothetical protein|nr:hypothetical protein [Microscillaceae bacterium]
MPLTRKALKLFAGYLPMLRQVTFNQADESSLQAYAYNQGWKSLGWDCYQLEPWILIAQFTEKHQLESLCLPLVYWENFERRDHANGQSYQKAREDFDKDYYALLATCTQQLGLPILEDMMQNYDDEVLKEEGWDKLIFHYAFWQGQHHLYILQQCERDVQFGVEINFTVMPWSVSEPLPVMPIY